MIIKKFEEMVERFPGKTALKSTGGKSFTYSQLNHYANRVALEINGGEHTPPKDIEIPMVSLLFEHGCDVIAAIIGTLKANRAYVALDVNYPQKRLLYMLDHSGSTLILTNQRNLPLAEALVHQSGKEIGILTIDNLSINDGVPTGNIEREVSGERPAYVLYTSGSTGRPKGVVQDHQNILYFVSHWTQRYSVTEADRLTLLASLSHDGAVPDIFVSLLNGAALYPYDIKTRTNINELEEWLVREEITIWHSVPTFYRYFSRTLTGKETFPHLRLVILGGEEVREYDIRMSRRYFPHAVFSNIYGQSESTVNAIWLLPREESFEKVVIGDPIGNTGILVVDENGDVVEEIGAGEIVVASEHVAKGYWKDKEATDRVFTHDSELGRLYWTGDLGRLTADGHIVISGRKDFQIKIRGFRVETAEIESVLLRHDAVKEVVIAAREDDKGDIYLCAFMVSDENTAPAALREYLGTELPDYMIPRYFVHLAEMPVTPSGKIDRGRLPEVDITGEAESTYEAPRNEMEKTLAAIWEEVLGVERIGITDNFVERGGHSLLVISVISKIHQELNVELQLRDVFDNPTIKQLARLIAASEEKKLPVIPPAEENDSYTATPDQKRMFVLGQLEGIGTTYNLTVPMQIEGTVDRGRLDRACRSLIKRHEALRTSFEMKEKELVQVIHEQVDFHVPYIDAEAEGRTGKEEIREIIEEFVRPFDLSRAPLLRVSLVRVSEDKSLLLFDLHHIIADGVSGDILSAEFLRLYAGEELPPLKLRYRDYSEWQNSFLHPDQVKRQETYWLNRFSGEIPVLDLPLNYPRPEVQEFAGDEVGFTLGKEVTRQLKQLVKETGATLYIVLLAMYYVLLHKYSEQEDIVVGSIISGRNHPDLAGIVGFFAKTLALRNYPAEQKTFDRFLEEVRDSTLEAFENQVYPFNQLVEKLKIKNQRNRNPLFDAAFVLQNTADAVSPGEKDVHLEWKTSIYGYGYKPKTSIFDLTLDILERNDELLCCFFYRSNLFKKDTIELMKERFIILVENILNNRETKLQDLDYTIPVEREMVKTQEVEFDF